MSDEAESPEPPPGGDVASDVGATAEAEPAAEPRVEDTTGRSQKWTRAQIFIVVALTLVAGGLRMWNLSDPGSLVFDEVYYAKDGCWYALSSEDVCEIGAEQTTVHPPLGKWLIAIGIKIFGYDSFGWRFVPALAGIAAIPLLFALARRLLRSTLGATLATGLLAIDFLHLVQSRIAMLDIFVPLFGLAAILCLVKDRDRTTVAGPAVSLTLARPWRAAAGVFAGAATASKWSGAFFVILVILLALAWETAARRREGASYGRSFGRTLLHEGPSIVLLLGLLPILVYALTFIGRIDGSILALPWSDDSWYRALWNRQFDMLGFHHDLEASHPYQSPPWSWILLKRPVSYFFCSGANCDPAVGDGTYKEIFASGSPFVWWSSIVAVGWLAIAWLRRRDHLRPEGLILAGVILTYGPWLLPVSEREAVFIFYLLPTIPFLCLALGYAAVRIGRSWEARAAIALFCVGALGFLWFYLPLINKMPLSQEEWQRRMLFEDCDKPSGETVTETVTTEDDQGNPIETTTEKDSNANEPPPGWCWI